MSITYRVCRWDKEMIANHWDYGNIEDAIRMFESNRDLGGGAYCDFLVRKDGNILIVFK